VEVDLQWMRELAARFEATPVANTAQEACSQLGLLGVSIPDLHLAINTQQLTHPSFTEEHLSIYSYTLAFPNVHKPVSDFMNHPVMRIDPSSVGKLDACMMWLKKLDVSYEALPREHDYEGDAFRGLRDFSYSDEQWERWAEGMVTCWYTFKSVATQKSTISDNEYFCGRGAGQRTVFIMRSVRGKLIKAFSAFPNEEEALVRPLTFFEVVRKTRGSHAAGHPIDDGCADIIELKMLQGSHWPVPRSRDSVKGLVQRVSLRQQRAEAKASLPLLKDMCEAEATKWFNAKAASTLRQRYHAALIQAGACLISGSMDETLKVWDVLSGNCEKTLTGHSSLVMCVTALGTERCISGSFDETLKVWDVLSGNCEKTLTGHSSLVMCVTALGTER